MRIRINGQWQEHPDGLSMAEMVERLALHPQRIAVERNKALLPRARYAETTLADNDELEIVTLVGGG
ncbi:MAG TPA: sulfur carrier protein ThiS [Phycisphaerae bacterium]|nr:sulfur carrier protein ThiS [Phycisphaerae bacterium]